MPVWQIGCPVAVKKGEGFRKEEDAMEPYFQKALSDMVFENACGAAIRRMVDRGCTTRQIVEQLDYPLPFDRAARAVTDYLLEQGILLREKPAKHEKKAGYQYVQERGRFGKTSFRKVPLPEDEEMAESIYVPCDFGLPESESGLDLSVLNDRQREFLDGICWEKKRMYYRLDERMEEIMKKLAQ